MNISQIAVQLYTLRDHLKTPHDIVATLKKVRAIGYQAAQVSGLGPISEEELVKIAADSGMVLCATHEDGATILNEPGKVVERLDKLGVKITAYPYPAGINFDSLESVR